MQFVPWDHGKFSVLASEDLVDDQLQDLKSGLKIHQVSRKFLTDTSKELASHIRDWFGCGYITCIILDDGVAEARPTDPPQIQRDGKEWIRVENKLLAVVSKDLESSQIRDVINYSDMAWGIFGIGLRTPLLPSQTGFTIEDLMTMSTLIVLSAYDRESFLIWRM